MNGMPDLAPLRADLVAAGWPADMVQWADDPATVPVEGGNLIRRTDEGLVLTLFERGREVAPETFDDERVLIETLRRRLLVPATARARTPDEVEVDRARMQEKARRTLAKFDEGTGQ